MCEQSKLFSWKWTKMFLLVSNVSIKGVIIVLFMVRGETLRNCYMDLVNVFECQRECWFKLGIFLYILIVLYSPLKCQLNHLNYGLKRKKSYSLAPKRIHDILGPLFTWASVRWFSFYNLKEPQLCKSQFTYDTNNLILASVISIYRDRKSVIRLHFPKQTQIFLCRSHCSGVTFSKC